jgi:hypothetical protein
MIRFEQCTRHAWHTLTIGTLLVSAMNGTVAHAQGTAQKIGKAALSVASFAADLSLANAAKIDVEARGLAPVPMDALQVGVAKVDVKNGVAVRLHLFYFNPTEQPVTVALPTDETFALVDARGRRFQQLSLRFPGLPKGATQLVVPHLERQSVDLVFALDNSADAEAILKLGPSAVLRGVPIRADAGAPNTTPNATPNATTSAPTIAPTTTSKGTP